MEIQWCSLCPVEMIIQENRNTVEIKFENEIGSIVTYIVPIEVAKELKIGVMVDLVFKTHLERRG